MTEHLQHHGHPCELPEPELVGDCQACGGEMYKHQQTRCVCERIVHQGCLQPCVVCKVWACRGCLIEESDGNWVCKGECQNAKL